MGTDNTASPPAEMVERYNMFDAGLIPSSCSNSYIGLSFGYDVTQDKMPAQISHRLFLLNRGDQDSYSLECTLKVCDKNDLDSDCNKWSVCETDARTEYNCAGACNTGVDCVLDTNNNDLAVCREQAQSVDCSTFNNDQDACEANVACTYVASSCWLRG